MTVIECENLKKEFELTGGGKEVAVDSLDFSIEDNNFVTVVGPSGCGKTTLLRMIAGLENPTEGRIFFDGDLMNNVPPQDRRISMVFQDITLYPFKSVGENIEYGLKYIDIDEETKEEKINELSQMVGISDLLNKMPNQLSGGQQQRAALARALIRDPNVFLLDEPLSDLDAKLKDDLRSELKELHREFPITAIYVTHDQKEAMTLSDEVIVMNDGKIMQQGPPTDIYHNPNNIFVAQFMGSPSINLFDVELEDSRLSSKSFNNDINIPSEIAEDLHESSDDRNFVIGIRPSDFKIADDNGIISTNVRIFEQLGDETVVHLTVMSNNQEITIVGPHHEISEEYDTMNLTFQLEDTHIFDKSSGEVVINNIGRKITANSI